MRMFMAGQKIPENPSELLFGSVTGSALMNAADLPDNAQICNCNGVCKRDRRCYFERQLPKRFRRRRQNKRRAKAAAPAAV